MRFKTLRPLAVAAAALALGACVEDGDELLSLPPAAGNTLFDRYVSLGNSITAGFQSGGLTSATQAVAYPVLLAQRAGAPSFSFPAVTTTGCPVPFTGPLTPSTVAQACTRTDAATLSNLTRNVAVPGARIADLLRIPPGATAQLHLLLNGPQTQISAMRAASPSFVSVWIGNNDALEATLRGVTGPLAGRTDSTLTPLGQFQGSLNAVVDSIRAAGPQGAMLVGVVNAIDAVPLIQPGAFFFLAAQATGGNFQGKPVSPTCAPGSPFAFNYVSFQILSSTVPVIDCSGATASGEFILDAAEQAQVRARVTAFNNAIKAAADANNWLYIDPNAILTEFAGQRDTQNRFQRVRKCQLLTPQTTPAQFAAAVGLSCPVPGATGAPNLFGTLISFDGVHPSTEAHRILAGRFAAAINTKYSTTLPTNEN